METEIATDRCLLRGYEAADREKFVELNRDAVVRRHMNGPLSAEQADGLFRRILGRGDPGRLSWAVTEKSSGDYIGHVFLTHEGEAGHEFGFMLTRDRWGRGLATEIAGTAVQHILTLLKISGVFATADADHPASQRVLEKAGFRHVRDESDEFGTYRVYRFD